MKILSQVGLLIGISAIGYFFSPASEAQIIRANDGTGTIVTPIGNQINITEGTRSGTNLFHSFQQFDPLKPQTASFAVPAGVQNILARVTSGNASLIQGTLQVNGANLYLMNPAGIVFGKDAKLDINGAFVATTANGIGFGNGKWFSAIGQNNYTELTGLPTQFAFTENTAGSIVQASGSFSSKVDQPIALIGGSILASKTWETKGAVALATVGGRQTVTLNLPNSILGLSVQVDPLNFGQSTPNRWTIPIQSLPSLLTGDGVPTATDLQVNSDGTITLTAPEVVTLAVKPGDLVIHSLKTPPNGLVDPAKPRSNYDILLDAQNTFRAVGTIPNSSITAIGLAGINPNGSNNEISFSSIPIPTSIRTIGKITLRHGGSSFVEAIGSQRDAKGIVLQDKNTQKRVVIDGNKTGSSAVLLKYQDGTFFDPNLNNTLISDIPDPQYNPATILATQSYTKGIIAIQSNNGNGSLLGVLQDSTLPDSSNIQISTAVRLVGSALPPTILSETIACQTETETIALANTRSSQSSNNRCKTKGSIASPTASTPILKVEPSVNESFPTTHQLTPDRPR
jgi:filamentous hemagglutinin family protein